MQAEKHLFFGACAAAIGVLRASTTGAASLKWRITWRRIWLERFGGGQRGVQSPLAAADQVEAGMFAGEALGRTDERVAFELGECLADGGFLEELAELG
jgi:hypothetical protein